jgi:Protein of unknown function (DUF1186)/SEC-C motif
MKLATRPRSSRPGQYPVATIAAYGPDNKLATKLVVSVHDRPGRGGPSEMRTWTTQAVDVRHDTEIAAEVVSFVQQHRAKQTVAPDRIIGCPHEEGIDYPMGRTCPRCPFWAGIDRFTHDPITPAVPTMGPAEILTALSSDGPEQPREALESADGHRPLLIEPLLRALDDGLANPTNASPEEATLFCYALYLLAKWREPRAYPYVVRWLSLPGEAPFDIAGDIVTQDGGRILAAVCDGDLEPIKALVVDRNANGYGRSAGVTALALLAAWAEVPHESIVSSFLWLAREGLEREPGPVWNSLMADSADIEALLLFPELRRAYADGLIEPYFMHVSELDQVEAAPRGSMLERTRERHPPIDDVVEATAWWARVGDAPESGVVVDPVEPYRAPPKVGRNDPCPCGSGKKFKKCCGA